MRVKKSFIYLLVLLCLLSSCKNFFNGQDFLSDLDQSIIYQNSQTYTVRVQAPEGIGTIIAGLGNNECKVTDSIAIGFQKNSGYNFIEWRAVSKDDETVSRADYVSFKNKNALETTVTLVQGADDILIIPVCDKTFKIEKALPEDSETGVCCDSAIQLNFTYPLSEENDLSQVKIYDGSVDVTANFKTPKIEDDTLLIFADTENRINVAAGEKRTLTVQLPEDFTYDSDNGSFEIGKDIKHSYRINSSTTNKVKVTFSVVDEAAGTLKLNDVLPSVYTFEYNIGESVEITYKLNDTIYFAGWDCSDENAVLITPVKDEETDENGFNESTRKVTLKMTVLAESEDEVTILLKGVEKDKCYLNISSDKGRFTGAASATYRIGDSADLSFSADPDYQFLYWKVTNANVNNVSDYIQIEDLENPNTRFVIKDIPVNSPSFSIEPECATRPKIVSATPGYDTEGVYRDRRITIMFDKKLDADSIYYTKDELISLGVWDSSKGLNSKQYVLLGDQSKPYGYKDKITGEITWKCLTITKLSDQTTNLLSCYAEPKFDSGNTGVLRISTKTDPTEMPPVSTDILITIKKDIGVKAQISENKYAIVGLSSVYSWSYCTNTKQDSEPPTIQNVDFYILKNGTTYPINSDGTLVGEKIQPLDNTVPDVNNYPVLNVYGKNENGTLVNSTNLWLKAEVLDTGSGPASLTMKAYRVQNGYYANSKVKVVKANDNTEQLKSNTSDENLAEPDFTFSTNLSVTGSVGLTSCYDTNGQLKAGYGNLIKLVNDNKNNTLTEEGLYAIELVATDKNDLSTTYNGYFYFLLDNTPPDISKVDFKENRAVADKSTISWKNPDLVDLGKYTVKVYEGETEKKTCSKDINQLSNQSISLNTYTDLENFTLEDQHKYKYKFTFFDLAGNPSETRIVEDNDAPDFKTVKLTEKRTSADKATVSWTNPSLNDLSKYTVQVYEGSEKKYETAKIDCLKGTNMTFATESKLNLEDQHKYKYKFTFYDFSGNKTDPVVVVDDEKPDFSTIQFTEKRTSADKATISWTNPALKDLSKYTVKVYEGSEKQYETADKINCPTETGMTFATESKLTLVDQHKYKYEFTFYDFSGNSSVPVVVVDDKGPKTGSKITYSETYARDKLKVNFKKSTDEEYSGKTEYVSNNKTLTVTSNATTLDLRLSGTSQKHSIQITDYDWSGNKTVSTFNITAVPAIGMIYYADGYWAAPEYYDSNRTPEGVICNVASNNTSFYIWDIWDQYGYCWGRAKTWINTKNYSTGLEVYNSLMTTIGETELKVKGMSRKNNWADGYLSPTVWSYVIGKNKESTPVSVSSEKWFIPSQSEMEYVFSSLIKMETAFDTIQEKKGSAIQKINANDYAYKQIQMFEPSGYYWTCMLHWSRTTNGSPTNIFKYGDINTAGLNWLGFYINNTLGTITYKENQYFISHAARDTNADISLFYMDRCIRYADTWAEPATYTSVWQQGDMKTHAMALVELK